jgi:hypothetical protein
MDCLTCEQLTAEFERLERHYATARGHLDGFSGISNAELYNRMRRESDDARLEFEVSRIELERHQRTHRVQSAK